MPCTGLENILRGCDNNIGGIREIYLFDMEDISAYADDDSSWLVTSLAINVSGGPTPFTFIRNSSNYTEDETIDLANGSTFVTGTVNLVFTRREASKSRAIHILGEGQRYLGAVIKDSNGLYWYMPDLQLSAAGEGSGTATADGSKYSVTLTGEYESLAKGIEEADALEFITTGAITP